jgi:PKD repeat protein
MINRDIHIITPSTPWGSKKTKDQELRERQDEEALIARLMCEQAAANAAVAEAGQAGPFGYFNPTRGTVADFSATTTGNAPFTVTFNNLTPLYALNHSNCVWNFGDGTTSTSPNPVHTYANTGSYTPTLVLTNKSEPFVSSTTATKNNYISASLPQVTVDFTVIPASRTGSAPLTVTLTDISSIISSTGTNTIRWVLSGSIPGSPILSSSVSPFTTVLTSGSWDVKLEETGSWGLSGVRFKIANITSSV